MTYVEYSFGDYYEVHEDSPLFQFICELCNLSLTQDEEEIILYQNDEEYCKWSNLNAFIIFRLTGKNQDRKKHMTIKNAYGLWAVG